MSADLIYPNGIDALTGEALLPALSPQRLADLVQGQPLAAEELRELKRSKQSWGEADGRRGTMAGVNPNNLAEAGWGVIFAEGDPQIPAIREALGPLLRLRREQAGGLYRDGGLSPRFRYQSGDAKASWLSRNGGSPGVVDPKKVPYYLLIVGDPTLIPYRFQYQLDIAYAVGRIHFETLAEYENYARSVVAAETTGQQATPNRKVAFFGARNGADRATQLSSNELVDPLAAVFGQRLQGWQVQTWNGEAATKAQMSRLLGGDETPAFLFSASHGMGFGQVGHPRQREEQGALICSDWPGVGALTDSHYLAARDIGDDAHLQGLIAFFFACYGAGTPKDDEFAIRTWQGQGVQVGGLEQVQRIPIAPQAFIARLPQRLLGHPNGGALAVVGHVDRAWGASFIWEGQRQETTFDSALQRLFAGERLGVATEDFNVRYAELGAEVSDRITQLKEGEPVRPEELARLWTASSDARNYVVLGDPAVRLAGGMGAAASVTPQVEQITVAAAAPAVQPSTEASKPVPGLSRTLYALFVGIDIYPSVVRSLSGCVNDVTALHDLLAARVAGAGERFAPLLLTNAQATRQGVIDAFRTHLGQAGPGDVALFYYGGHGSQENAPPEFWDFEPDRMNETLVCHDSRAAGGWDLADKELAQLISEVAANGPHFVVILDCCHSGSGTRDAEEITVRQEKADHRTRPIGSYIVTPQQVAGRQGQPREAASPAAPWAAIASGRHILLAACRPEQTAKEDYFPGPSGYEKRGAFSYYLQDTLQQTGAALSYRDLFKRVNALVQGRVPDQHPQLEASEPADLEQPFLGGAIPAAPAVFTLSADKDLGWVVDAGAVHGIPSPAESGETTQFALFPFDADLARLRSLEQAIGQASVVQVFPGQSLVAPMGRSGVALSTKTTYKAVVTSTPLPPLAVAFEGDPAALDYVRQALANINGPGAPSLLVREGDGPGAEYRLLADAEQRCFRIRRAADALRFAVDTPGLDPRSASIVAQRLEHIARWISTARLTNPATGLARDAVRLDVFREGRSGELEPLDTSSGLRLAYEQRDGKWRWPSVQIRLHNTTPDQRFFCMLLDLTETYSVYAGLLPEGGVWLEPGQETWATVLVRGRLRKTIDLYIPDNLWRQGVTELRDILKLIVSTDEADATLLQQGELPVTFAPTFRKMPARLNTLNRLMARVHTRDFGAAPGSDEAFSDWMTAEVAVTIVRSAEAGVV